MRRRRAEEIARRENVDPGDVDHAIHNLTLGPDESLRKSMRRAGFELSEAEKRLLGALVAANVPFMVVGLGAAAL